MSVNLTLLLVMGVLYAVGIYLLLERSLTRVLLALMLLANATNLLLLTTGGYAGLAPIFSKDIPASEFNDPLPQAFILTSIVISFAVTAFMLSLIYRSWLLSKADHIQVDMEDIRVAKQEIYDDEEDSEIAVEISDFHENDQPLAKRETVPGIGPKKTPLAPDATSKHNGVHPVTPGKDKE
ncbi:Na(+)/H(+) antiporter subunit C [Arthrobacter psychrolactophilus]|uniref:Na(+)/H(+) antiporter subunit C n=1 Tax=Arthrobacter psychrolactophilus TaxID=92442 RepID=A0A2V5IRJ1_9MICC|nr:Na(+)/H(+) antiporter subunit C [Arthrobacter psychrolactophilus]PYI39168.1 Na(+)/H(+) antiporter subunit C [Arthrobacter psychrolactophilus]